ncbi:MAG: Ig-like domain-containing protein [Bacillota bacterium]|nr:Ig-like domain-containing protein [Bacillota bacterium]
MGEKSLIPSKMKLLLFIFALSSLFMGQIVFAEGDGSGGGQNQPLTLVSSSIADGATGVPLKPQIKLTFSKNIVNATTIDNNNTTVRDHNMQCFSLLTANGTKVSIDIFMADDQVDFEARNDAVITPKANLDPGTTYFVVVSKDLEAKNFSAKTGQEIRITFTTVGVKPSATSSAASSVTTPQTNTAAAAATAPKAGTTAPSANTASNDNTNKGSQAAVQSSTVPSGTNTLMTTAKETTNSRQQKVANTPEKMTTGSKTGTKEVHKPKKAAKNQMKPSQSNSSFIVIAVSVLIIIAVIFIYLWIKKKRIKIK